MKVVMHTPRVLVETYNVPDTLADATDAEVAAFIESGEAETVGSQVRRVGRPRVHTRTTTGDDITAAGHRLSDARAAVESAMNEAREMAVSMLESGAVSERAVAEALALDRNTVRAWRGKPRSA